MATAQTLEGLVIQDSELRGGRPIIAGTGVTVRTVVSVCWLPSKLSRTRLTRARGSQIWVLSAVTGRAARIRQSQPRDAAPTIGGSGHHHQPRRRLPHLSRQLSPCCGHEPMSAGPHTPHVPLAAHSAPVNIQKSFRLTLHIARDRLRLKWRHARDRAMFRC